MTSHRSQARRCRSGGMTLVRQARGDSPGLAQPRPNSSTLRAGPPPGKPNEVLGFTCVLVVVVLYHEAGLNEDKLVVLAHQQLVLTSTHAALLPDCTIGLSLPSTVHASEGDTSLARMWKHTSYLYSCPSNVVNVRPVTLQYTGRSGGGVQPYLNEKEQCIAGPLSTVVPTGERENGSPHYVLINVSLSLSLYLLWTLVGPNWNSFQLQAVPRGAHGRGADLRGGGGPRTEGGQLRHALELLALLDGRFAGLSGLLQGEDRVVVGKVAATVGAAVETTVGSTVVVTVGGVVVQARSSSGQSCSPSHHFSSGRQSLLVGQILVPGAHGVHRHSQEGKRACGSPDVNNTHVIKPSTHGHWSRDTQLSPSKYLAVALWQSQDVAGMPGHSTHASVVGCNGDCVGATPALGCILGKGAIQRPPSSLRGEGEVLPVLVVGADFYALQRQVRSQSQRLRTLNRLGLGTIVVGLGVVVVDTSSQPISSKRTAMASCHVSGLILTNFASNGVNICFATPEWSMGPRKTCQGKSSFYRRERVPVVSIHDLVAGDILVEERISLHQHPVYWGRARQFYLDVLVGVLGGWVPTARCGSNSAICKSRTGYIPPDTSFGSPLSLAKLGSKCSLATELKVKEEAGRGAPSQRSYFTGCLTLHAETQQCKHCCFTAGLASKMVVAIRADLAQGPALFCRQKAALVQTASGFFYTDLPDCTLVLQLKGLLEVVTEVVAGIRALLVDLPRRAQAGRRRRLRSAHLWWEGTLELTFFVLVLALAEHLYLEVRALFADLIADKPSLEAALDVEAGLLGRLVPVHVEHGSPIHTRCFFTQRHVWQASCSITSPSNTSRPSFRDMHTGLHCARGTHSDDVLFWTMCPSGQVSSIRCWMLPSPNLLQSVLFSVFLSHWPTISFTNNTVWANIFFIPNYSRHCSLVRHLNTTPLATQRCAYAASAVQTHAQSSPASHAQASRSHCSITLTASVFGQVGLSFHESANMSTEDSAMPPSGFWKSSRESEL
ncbi:hypothetical protein MSG28_003148 [Choristoneura fumiferana]|uniref:Uncharacterized protein n=1 Tax=Choristoneura fumiferana TaxID=7141 RepID=A0ACC0KES3_CHOFU|nr:hypothetical protein MSG28_003148 [Choristoneura fumiferana]